MNLTIAGRGEETLISRLWQLYRHDLSEFRGTRPDADGLFPLEDLPGFFVDPDRRAYLAHDRGSIAGFALVAGLQSDVRYLREFFVLRSLRGAAGSRELAVEVLRSVPGPWMLVFQEENQRAARFWRATATSLVGENGWAEQQRPVPGKPEAPSQIWMNLTVAGVQRSNAQPS